MRTDLAPELQVQQPKRRGAGPSESLVLSRRVFLGGISVSTAFATGLVPNVSSLAQSCPPGLNAAIPHFTVDTTTPVLPRKPIDQVQLDFVEITRLKSAYAALKLRPQNDAHAWMQQADVHNCYCGVSEEIHGTWYFYPWHRAYLYFHERILGKLIGDKSFRLPYWAWDRAGQNRLPTAYRDPTLSLNPLFDTLRVVDETMVMPQNVFTPSMIAAGLERTELSNAFLGTERSGVSLENLPHGSIHVWIGGTDPATRRAKPDMGIPETAARDPVFFAHHANLDRLWNKWLNLPRRKNHSASSWLDKRWTFFDENLNLVWISVRDVLNHEENLRYSYDQPVPASAVPSSSGTTTIRVVPFESNPGGRALGTIPTTVSVNIDPLEFSALVGARPELGAGVLLEIDGIDIPPGETALVNVFFNKPNATAATSLDDLAFVGGLSSFPAGNSSQHVHARGKRGVALDVTSNANALPFGTGTLFITLVPTTFDMQPPASIDVKFDNIQLRVVRQE